VIKNAAAFGYDGKGPRRSSADGDDPDRIWEELGTKIRPSSRPSFRFEREDFGESPAPVPPAARSNASMSPEKRAQWNHILKISRGPPAAIPGSAGGRRHVPIAEKKIRQRAWDYVGVLAVEMFVVQADGGPKILGQRNSAAGCHNSGHWDPSTAPRSSQFEQHNPAPFAGWAAWAKPVRSWAPSP